MREENPSSSGCLEEKTGWRTSKPNSSGLEIQVGEHIISSSKLFFFHPTYMGHKFIDIPFLYLVTWGHKLTYTGNNPIYI